MSGAGRNIYGQIWKNFINSFKSIGAQHKGNYKGQDNFGNKYYEIPADPSRGRRKTARWFEPLEKDNYGQEISGEWESWLRNRRQEPPTEEEVMRNLAIAQLKKKNAAILEAKADAERGYKIENIDEKGISSFPKYDEYEQMPGKKKDEK
ncbi:NADH dehydrogenase [ubiquinone] 1 alpha subcomplex assembly factor 2 [Culicoides brevitarsis]|uniref:NADH dehydrogenase [ubiquinone] 1 alpha subcomplex assembly factor 2 n=1 Tax=Culicoides brevitarsis TaxID=469753 RepID=UPI00307C960C